MISRFFDTLARLFPGEGRGGPEPSKPYDIVVEHRKSLKDDVHSVFDFERFDAYMCDYLKKPHAMTVRMFINNINIGKKDGKTAFWHSRLSSASLNASSISLQSLFSGRRSSYEVFRDEQNDVLDGLPFRKAGVSPFETDEAMELAESMKRHPEIVYPIIVLQDALQSYMRDHVPPVLSGSNAGLKQIRLFSQLNSYFSELMPFFLEAAEEDPSLDLRGVVKVGIHRAFEEKIHESYSDEWDTASGQTRLKVKVTRCPFSDFFMGTLSRSYEGSADSGFSANGTGYVGQTLDVINQALSEESLTKMAFPEIVL